MKRLLLPILVLFLLPGAAWAVDFPPPAGFVTDTVNLLTPAQRQEIESELKSYEAKTGTEIAVLIVADTQGMSAADYATGAGNKWGVGKKGADNGALVLIAMEKHDIWIAVGRQLEGALTDSQAGAIVRKVVAPRFKAGDFYGGLKEGITAIEKTIAGESFTNERMSTRAGNQNAVRVFEYALFFGVMLLSWLAALAGRTKEIWPGGAAGAIFGGIISWYFAYSLLWMGIIAVVGGVLGLAFDWVATQNYDRFRRGGPTPPWWMGGGGISGGGSSDGGFGGFGGGGFSGGGGGDNW